MSLHPDFFDIDLDCGEIFLERFWIPHAIDVTRDISVVGTSIAVHLRSTSASKVSLWCSDRRYAEAIQGFFVLKHIRWQHLVVVVWRAIYPRKRLRSTDQRAWGAVLIDKYSGAMTLSSRVMPMTKIIYIQMVLSIFLSKFEYGRRQKKFWEFGRRYIGPKNIERIETDSPTYGMKIEQKNPFPPVVEYSIREHDDKQTKQILKQSIIWK